ncbi:MAG: YqaA family protein [Gemmatimonadaceae bacterium]
MTPSPSSAPPPRASPLAVEQRSARGGNRFRRALLHGLAALHRWAEAGWSGPAAGTWALLQGSIVPGPSEGVFGPLAVADARRAFRLAAWTLVGSFLGGCIAYALGAGGSGVLGVVGVDRETIEGKRALFERWGALLVFAGALTPPVPVKLINIAAGALHMAFAPFALALFAGRAIRYFALATLLRFAGERLNARLRRTLGRGVEQLH